jgi:hypothetical protein
LSPRKQTFATVLQHQKYEFRRQITDNSAITAFCRLPGEQLAQVFRTTTDLSQLQPVYGPTVR